MNRAGVLVRRTPLRRGGRLRSRSAKRQATTAHRQAVWAEVMLRDRGCQLRGQDRVGRCFGRLTPHHLHKASAGGGFEMGNIVALCAFHNDWVEDHPMHAAELGLVRR